MEETIGKIQVGRIGYDITSSGGRSDNPLLICDRQGNVLLEGRDFVRLGEIWMEHSEVWNFPGGETSSVFAEPGALQISLLKSAINGLRHLLARLGDREDARGRLDWVDRRYGIDEEDAEDGFTRFTPEMVTLAESNTM
jgi:hypothetical protein